MTEILPRSTLIHVQFEVALPADATKEEVLEWIAYAVDCGGIAIDNPLYSYGIEPVQEPLLTRTDTYLHRDKVVHADGTMTIYSKRLRWPSNSPLDTSEIISDHISGKGDA